MEGKDVNTMIKDICGLTMGCILHELPIPRRIYQ
jgi:hypothetical protein